MAQIDTKEYIKEHIARVRNHMNTFVQLLHKRALLHDKSKLEEPELSWWEAMDKEPRYPYGSEEYKVKVAHWKKVFSHHYKHNRHHPEHYENGIADMTLVDLVEMLCDWLGYKDVMTVTEAVTVCEQQMERHHFTEELRSIMTNTLLRYFSLLGGFNTNFSAESFVNTPDGILEELNPLTEEDMISKNEKKSDPPGSIIDIYI